MIGLKKTFERDDYASLIGPRILKTFRISKLLLGLLRIA